MRSVKVLNFNLPLLLFGLALFALMVTGCNESAQSGSVRSGNAIVNKLRPDAIRIIREGLADEDPRVRSKAVEVVAAAKLEELSANVQKLLADEYVPVRFAAALALGDMRYRPAKTTIERLLKDPDTNVVIAAAYALSKLGSKGGLALLAKAAKSSDQTVRANAVFLLGRSGDKRALEVLEWVQKDENSDDKVRLQVLEARARLGDKQVFQRLWAIALSSYADDRIMAVKAMGVLGTVKAKEVLVTKLDDDVLEVRLAAAEQLGMLGETIGEPEVLYVFTKNLTAGFDQTDLERINGLTALAIGRIRTAAVTKFLPRLLEDKSKFVRIAAAGAVLVH